MSLPLHAEPTGILPRASVKPARTDFRFESHWSWIAFGKRWWYCTIALYMVVSSTCCTNATPSLASATSSSTNASRSMPRGLNLPRLSPPAPTPAPPSSKPTSWLSSMGSTEMV